jgi:hypothetical protein
MKEPVMTDDEAREWVRGRLAFEAWLKALHAARDEEPSPDDDIAAAVGPNPPRGAGRFSWLRAGADRRAAPRRGQSAA